MERKKKPSNLPSELGGDKPEKVEIGDPKPSEIPDLLKPIRATFQHLDEDLSEEDCLIVHVYGGDIPKGDQHVVDPESMPIKSFPWYSGMPDAVASAKSGALKVRKDKKLSKKEKIVLDDSWKSCRRWFRDYGLSEVTLNFGFLKFVFKKKDPSTKDFAV